MKPEAFVRTNLLWCCALLAACSSHKVVTRPAPVAVTRPAHVKARPVVAAPFVQEQLQFSRVREARDEAGERIERMFRARGIEYPASQIFIRVFKQERELLRSRRGLALGFGFGILAMTMIPGLNLLAMPTGVIAGTLLWVHEWKRIEPAP